MKQIIVFLSLIFIFFKSQAQTSSENKLGTWYMYNGSHKLSEKYSLKTSFHVRYFEFITEYQQEIYRLGLNYKINPNFNFTLGSVYSITDSSYKTDAPDLYEYRFYQDLNLKDNWGNFGIKHRVRLAQRFRRKNFENKTTHRIRYGLFLSYPISQKLTTYGFNEIFIKFATKAFGQNRTGFGFLQKLTKQIKLKLGYMHTQFSNSKSHRLQLGIILNTNHIRNI
ncbi:DUF2490 domain-containing protein [Polaribacter sp. R77954]|uniref:DUF2490 domain-containing protein n=1 Tax=Polaribacter sp. R77954 TaxID=3093870 RepID=UPI0037C80E87